MADPPEPGQTASASHFADKTNRRQWFLSRVRRNPGRGSNMAHLMALPRSPILLPVAEIFGEEPYAVVGGVATASYQPERKTHDIDVLVHADSISTVRERLRNLGAIQSADLAFPDSQLLLSGETWILPNLPPLDLMWRDAQWTREALTQAKPTANGVRIVPLAYLILMKIDSCWGKDQGDLAQMLGFADDATLDAVRKTIARYMPDAYKDTETYIEIGRIEIGDEARRDRLPRRSL